MAMAAEKLPSEDSAICPIEVVRDMACRLAGVHSLAARRLDKLLARLAAETLEAFSGAAREELLSTAVAFGREHWSLWGDVVEWAQKAMKASDVPHHANSDFAAKWEMRANNTERCLPKLTSRARVLYRATAFLMLESARGEPGRRAAEYRAKDPKWPWTTPVKQVSDNILAVHALHQAVYVAGELDGGFSEERGEELVRALWQVVTVNLDPERTERAYIAALQAESSVASDQLEMEAANDADVERMFAEEQAEEGRRDRARAADLAESTYYVE